MPSARETLRRADPVLARLMEAHSAIDLWAWRARWPRDRFALLVRSIVGQQISTSAASAIFARLDDLLASDFSAHGMARRSDEQLRGVGLSRAKLASLRDLSQHILVGTLEIDRLEGLPDDEVRRQLTAVRGIGPWTAELFLLVLGRDDALPAADVGLRRAMRAVYRLDHLPSTAEVETIGEAWRPYRSLAAAYLYASLHRPIPSSD
ncbi:MAG TPA: DNA-3-methyladenine glycosylase 2 family protein [Thermoleophilia bacterium]|nr:DNA-3-methyladenine glycosylase 2 family protein [Thermoleophilia bacterium]